MMTKQEKIAKFDEIQEMLWKMVASDSWMESNVAAALILALAIPKLTEDA